MLNTRRRRALACAGATAALCGVMAPGALAGPLNAGGPVDLLTESNVAIGNLADASKIGDKIIAAGDFNGDGRKDVATAGWFINGNNPTRTQGGAVYVIFGKAAPGSAVDLAATSTDYVKIEGALAADHLGWSLAPAGDVNGDGKDDLLIGAPWADPGTTPKNAAGGARVVYGRASTTEIDLATDTQGFRIDGAADGDRAGFSVATGDVNGDGRRDFILGAIGTACRNGNLPLTCQGDAGAAYVVFGKANQGNVDLASLGSDGFRMNGESGDSRAGWAVTSGDYTGDGKADVAVSAIGASPGGKEASGTTYVVRGKTSTDAVNLGALGADGFRIDGEEGDQSGMSLASGDVDGDRKPELVIGVPFHNPDGSLMAGSAYVLKGGAMSGNMSLANPGAGNYRIDGAKTQDGAGWSVADLARPQRRRHRRRPARRAGRGPPVRAEPEGHRPAGVDRRRLRGVRLQDPVERLARHADRQGSAADGRRRLALGRPGRLERRGPRRHGRQRRQRGRRRRPRLRHDRQPEPGRRHRPRQGPGVPAQRRHRRARADDLDHVAARRRADPAGHDGRAGVLVRRRPDRRLLHRDRPRRGDRQRRQPADGARPGRPAHGHRDREGRGRQHDDQERHVQRGRGRHGHPERDRPGDAVAVAGLAERRPRHADPGHRGRVQRDHRRRT